MYELMNLTQLAIQYPHVVSSWMFGPSVRLTIGYSASGFYVPLRYNLFQNAYVVATSYSSLYE